MKDLLYTKEHEWAKKQGDLYCVGITDFAQAEMGEIVYVELPEIGDTIDKDEEFGSIETVKAVAELYMPLTGNVVAINEALEDSPELVNEDCYGEGWLIKIEANNLEELNDLLSFEEYQDFLVNS